MQLLASKKSDTTRLATILKIAGNYLNTQTDSALKYAELSYNLSKKLPHKHFKVESLELLGRAKANKGELSEALRAFKEQEIISVSNSDIAGSIRNQGNVLIETGKGSQAVEAYRRAIKYAMAAGNLKLVAICNSNIAYVLRQQGKYDEAYKRQIEVLKLAEKIDYHPLIAQAENQLALMQYSRKQWADAADHSRRALSFYQKLGNKSGMAVSYTVLGGVASELKSYEEARQHLNSAYQINLSLNEERQIANSACDLAQVDFALKKYDSALEKVNEAIPLLGKVQAINNLSTVYTLRCKIFTEKKDYNKAEADITKALSLSRSGNFKESEKKALEALSLLKSAEGDFNSAYEAQLKLAALKDSMFNADNSRQINELKTVYETEKKEQQISLLNAKTELQQLNLFNQELELEKRGLAISNKDLKINNQTLLLTQKESNIRRQSLEAQHQKQQISSLHQQSLIQKLEIKQKNISLIASGILLIFLASTGYFLYNRRKLAEQARLQSEINKQQEMAARAVLNAEERERRRIAGDLHDGVGQLLSAALMNLNGLFKKLAFEGPEVQLAERSLALVTESYDEMRSISHQMMPNALLKAGLASAVKEFLDKIDSSQLKISLETVGLNERLDEQTETVLYRVIQETVNNVIKHAKASKLNIQLIKDEDGISATIEDNGKGFDVMKLKDQEGIGLKNILSRVDFLKGTVDFDSTPGRGTLVAIHIPA